MAYPQDLGPVIQEVLALPDIRKAVDDPKSPLNDDMLRQRIQQGSVQVWQTLSSMTASYDHAEQERDDASRARDKLLARPAWLDTAGNIASTAGGFLILAAIVFGVAALFGARWPATTLHWIWTQRWLWIAVGVLLGASLLALARYAHWRWIQRPRRENDPALSGELRSREKSLGSIKQSLDDQLRSEVQKLATELINAAALTFFQDRLHVADPGGQPLPAGVQETTGPGLSETVTPAYEINTGARTRLMHTLESLPCASIGIAGPRGAGKTTLLGSLCLTNPKIGGKDALGVYTSAPVDYDARDFILHLYASLCRKVLITRNVAEDKGSPFGDDGRARRNRRRIGQAVMIFGAGLIALSLMIAMIKGSDAAQQAAARKTEAAAMASTAAQAAATATAAALAPPASRPPAAAPAKSAAPAAKRAAEPSPSPSEVFEAFDAKPGDIFLMGLFIGALGLGLILSDRWLEDDGSLPARLLGSAAAETKPPAPPEDPLVAKCQLALKEIRFQRSYSSGWSGELHLPAGIDFSQNRAVSMAQIQQSQPELVQAFRGLLADVAVEFNKVVIGIDELDKLRSDEEAQQFLNEIKSVFGVRGAFFLVSVSESAISNFERRGLPFRDAFDSAFDDIRFVDYMSLDDSRRLLSRRVINLPEPFLGLAHVMAGGLPREVIRFARAMLDQARAQGPGHNTLGEIAKALVTAEAAGKRRAMTFLARDAAVEPETTAFMQRLGELEAFDPLAPGLATGLRLKATPAAAAGKVQAAPEGAAARAKLDKLWRELDCFLYFAATTAELFAAAGVQARWNALLANGAIERLSKARQSLELGTGVAAFQITALRQANGLVVPP